MTTKTRFAPSPTGHLHVGNIRTALHNWMYAHKTGGTFWLRLDDTDAGRSKEEYAQSIRRDLAWLGLVPDGEVRQSVRFDIYEDGFEKLKAAGRVYACYETAQELELKRKILLGRGKPPVYDRGALQLTADQIAGYEAEGRAPHWRFRLDHDAPIAWTDLVRGDQSFDPALLSDPVIRREDGSWLYMLPSAIDDAEMGITHVVRGEDHVSNTAAQIQMFHALGVQPPQFAHEALLVGTEGKLSKRLGSLGVSTFRDQHIEPIAVTALLARLGTSDPVEPVTDIAPLMDTFDFARFGRAPARFDDEELVTLNQKIVHQLDYDAVSDRLPGEMDAAAWQAIRPNIANIREVAMWWKVVRGHIDRPAMNADDAAYLRAAHDALENLAWSDDAWHHLTSALKNITGRKGKPLFMPLRLALTGKDHGPDMNDMLPLIGRAKALERLSGF